MAAKRHLTPAAVKQNKNLKGCLLKQRTHKKNINRRLDFIKSFIPRVKLAGRKSA